MAGRGPAPKHASIRRRGNHVDMSTLRRPDGEQPFLPSEVPWPDPTLRWWQMWADSPQSDNFGPTDWDFLMDTALLHAEVWSGNLDRLSELRIRVAKFGATPEDRARLKQQYAEADIAEDRAAERKSRRTIAVKPGEDPRNALHSVG